MEGKIIVDYEILNGCIENLKTMTSGEDEVNSAILEIDGLFQGTQSATAIALKARQEELKTINNLVNSICINATNVLEMAKTIYKEEDEEMTLDISNITTINLGEM